MQRVRITDITLREAVLKQENALSFKETVEIAKILDRLKVDVIGIAPIVNAKVDALLVRTIGAAVKSSVIALPTGYTKESVSLAWNAVCDAAKPRLCVEVPLSAVQMEFMCRKKPDGILEMTEELVAHAASLCKDVEFAALDATRSEPDFLFKAVEKAVAAGASTVTVYDSAGTTMPREFRHFIESLYENVPSLRNVGLAVKCSDELAMAAACAITAVKSGAVEIDVTIGGGTAPTIESIAHIIKTRGDDCGLSSGIKTTELHRSVNQMNWITRTKSEKNSPFDTGLKTIASKDRDFLLDQNDDVSAVSKAVKRLGYELSEEDLAKVFESFTNVAAKKKSVGAKELEAIIASSALQVPPTYKLVSYVINSGNVISSTANIHCTKDGKDLHGLAEGDGPIDASFLAIENITGRHYELDDFQVQAVTEGREAMGSTLVKLRSNGKLYSGNGISTDILGASIRAYLNALNKIAFEENHQ